MDENNFPNIFEENTKQDLPSIKKLERSKTDVIISGACAGIANFLNIEPSIIRLISILSLLLGDWIILIYFAAVLIIPEEKNPKQLSAVEKEKLNRTNWRTVIGGMMMAYGINLGFFYLGFMRTSQLFLLHDSFFQNVIFVAFGIFFMLQKSEAQNYFLQNEEKLFRSNKDKIFLGVCGGLGKYLKVDSASLRIIIVITTLLSFGILAIGYFILALTTKSEGIQIEQG